MSYLPGQVCCYRGRNMASHGIIRGYIMARLISFPVSSPETNILPRPRRGRGRILVEGEDTGKDINIAML